MLLNLCAVATFVLLELEEMEESSLTTKKKKRASSTKSRDERSLKRAKIALEQQRMEAHASIAHLAQSTSETFKESQRSNKERESLEQIKVETELAKALGDRDRLEELFAELQNRYESRTSL